MDDYIKREDAQNAILEACGCDACQDKESCIGACDIHAGSVWNAVDNIPAADVRENVRGEWLYNETTDTFVCSHCGDAMIRNTYYYCPWCGADMRGAK